MKIFFYIVVFIAIFKPFMFNFWDFIDIIINVIRVLLFVFFSYKMAILLSKQNKISAITLIVIVMHLVILYSTLRNNGNIYRFFVEMLSSVPLLMFFELYGNDIERIFKIWVPVILILLIINLVTIFQGGIHSDFLTIYFLGSKNSFERVFAVFFLIIYINSLYSNDGGKYDKLCYIIMLISIVLTQSTTLIIELLTFIILWIFKNYSLISKKLTYYKLLLIYAIANILLLFNTYGDLIGNFLDDNLSKGSDSFLARVRMWEAGLIIFLDNPLFGVGKLDEAGWEDKVSVIDYHMQLHNQIIEYLVTGGIVLTGLLIYMFINTAKKLLYISDFKIYFILMISCFIMNIATLSEGTYSGEYFFPFMLTSLFYQKYKYEY